MEKEDLNKMIGIREKEAREVVARLNYLKFKCKDVPSLIKTILKESKVDEVTAYRLISLGRFIERNEESGRNHEMMELFKKMIGK